MKRKIKANKRQVIVNIFRNISIKNNFLIKIWTIVKKCVVIAKNHNCLAKRKA